MHSVSQSHRRSWLAVLTALATALWPLAASAACACGPAACGDDAGSSCCAPKDKAKSCCASDASPVEAAGGCCCVSGAKALACSSGYASAGNVSGGCACSPASPADPIPPVVPVDSVSPFDFAAVTLVAIEPPLAAQAQPSLAVVSFLPSPPIPLRELYCVWRN